MNPKKLLIFRPINKLDLTLSNIKLSEYLLTLTKSVMYLGTEMDRTLSSISKIEIHAKNLSRANIIHSKLRYYIRTETLTSIYFSFQPYVMRL